MRRVVFSLKRQKSSTCRLAVVSAEVIGRRLQYILNPDTWLHFDKDGGKTNTNSAEYANAGVKPDLRNKSRNRPQLKKNYPEKKPFCLK
jgi:hypothetical protein